MTKAEHEAARDAALECVVRYGAALEHARERIAKVAKQARGVKIEMRQLLDGDGSTHPHWRDTPAPHAVSVPTGLHREVIEETQLWIDTTALLDAAYREASAAAAKHGAAIERITKAAAKRKAAKS